MHKKFFLTIKMALIRNVEGNELERSRLFQAQEEQFLLEIKYIGAVFVRVSALTIVVMQFSILFSQIAIFILTAKAALK
jgi:hypothetical protein